MAEATRRAPIKINTLLAFHGEGEREMRRHSVDLWMSGVVCRMEWTTIRCACSRWDVQTLGSLVLRGRLAAATQSGLGLSQARRMTVLFAAHSYAAPRTCISHCCLQTIHPLLLATRASSPVPSRPVRTPIATATLPLRQR
jgi:hypothetical protein